MSLPVPRTVSAVNASISAVYAMPYGLARTQAAQEIVTEVERDGLHGAQAYALDSLVDAHFWSGETSRALVVFSRLLRLWDAQPERFDDVDQRNFFATLSWMAAAVQDDPQVATAQVEALVEDMASRFAVAGLAPSPVSYERMRWAVRTEDPQAEHWFAQWRTAREDPHDVCEHCRRTRIGMYLARDGRWAEVVAELGAPGLPEKGCPTEPADLLSLLALARLETGDAAGALADHRAFEAALPSTVPEMSAARGRRIAVLGRGGADAHAITAIEGDQHLLARSMTPWARLDLLTSVGSATAVMAERDPDRRVRLPDVPVTTLAELDTWVRSEAIGLATAFAERPGARAETSRLIERTRERMTAPTSGAVLDFTVLASPDGPLGIASAAGTTAGAVHVTAAGPTAQRQPVGGAPLDAAGPADQDAGATSSIQEPWQRHLEIAEAAHAAGDELLAAQHFTAAAAAAEAAGLLLEAGFAGAEAARCAEVLLDIEGAHAGYARACSRLWAGGAPAVDVVPVLVAWAPVAARLHREADVLRELTTAGARLTAEAAAAHESAAQDPKATTGSADSSDRGPGSPSDLARRRERARSRASADVLDAQARLGAAAADRLESAERASGRLVAAEQAVAAAEGYAAIGDLVDASHAFWLAGRVSGDDVTAAVWRLESAFEGFGISGRRTERGAVANELVALLRSTGQDEQAQRVLDQLA